MKLNQAKCAFGASLGKFLGFIVSQRGIGANLKNIQAIMDIRPSANTKQLQQLMGRVKALNRFVSRAMDKCLPFFKILRKAFLWGEDCDKAFKQLKEYLTKPPLLSRPREGEPLHLYLAASPSAVSSALMRKDSGVLRLVYYSSRALCGVETRYPQTKQLVFALVVAAKRLRPYFQAHMIKVLTDFLLKQILHKPEISGCLVKWVIKLGEFDLEYVLRLSMKGQVVIDFIVEFTDVVAEQGCKKDDLWTVNVDGLANKKSGGARVIVKSPKGQGLRYAIRLGFKITNNEVEYEAVIAGLAIAVKLGVQNIEMRSDSSVIVGQANGEFEAKEERMQKYLAKVRELTTKLKRVMIKKVPRSLNNAADQLARLVAASEDELDSSREQIGIVPESSITPTKEVTQVGTNPNWAESIIQFLEDGSLPED
jgi:ribonuclease HI